MAHEIDSINSFLDKLEVGADRTVDVVKKLIEGKENVSLTFKTEAVCPKPMPSPKRAHIFNAVEGLAAYLTKHGSDNIVILANPKTGCAGAIIDETAGSGFEVVQFKPTIHPFWEPWSERLGKPDRVKEFAKFVATQRHVIKAPDPKTLFLLLSQVRLAKSVTIEEGFGRKSVNGVMVESVVSSNPKVAVDLPESIVVHCPMFWGQEAADIQIDVLVDGSGDRVEISLSSADAEAKRIEQIEAMLGDLVSSLPSAVVTLGDVGHAYWNYVSHS